MSPVHVKERPLQPADIELSPSSRTSVTRGNIVACTARFTIAGIPVNPDNVTCTVKAPDGTLHHPNTTLVDQGTYQALVLADDNGPWLYRFESTGHGQAAGESSFFAKSQLD